jgi:hypothetical protein
VTEPSTAREQDLSIDLKDPAVAAVLAWLVPGLGHFYQGRTAKGLLFFICIVSTFLYGLYLGGSSELGWGRAVYASARPGDRRLPYLCQICAGLPALPALVQASRVRSGKEPLWGGFMAPPSLDVPRPGQPTVDTLHKKLHRFFELGTVFTMVAGLLNVLAIYDAWGGPVFTEEEKEEKKKKEDDEDGGPENSDAEA